MQKRHKSFIAGMFILVIIPLAMGVCCCIEDVFASISPAPQHHEPAHQHQHEHQPAADHGQESGDHDHGDCEHDELIASIPNVTSLGAQLPVAFSTLKNYVLNIISFEPADPKKTFYDTGPPGNHFTTTPIYLQISVLRI